MKRKRFSVEQIVAVLKQAELGMPVADLILSVLTTRPRHRGWPRSPLPSLCCFAPDVAVVETPHTGKPGDLRAGRRSRLEWPPVRRISQPSVNSVSVVVGDVFTKSPTQMVLVEHNHVVEQFAATSADPSFRDPVLPGASIGVPHGLRAKASDCGR